MCVVWVIWCGLTVQFLQSNMVTLRIQCAEGTNKAYNIIMYYYSVHMYVHVFMTIEHKVNLYMYIIWTPPKGEEYLPGHDVCMLLAKS